MNEDKNEGQREKVGAGRESTILISFEKHAIINFFACDRLDRVL